MGYHHDDWIAWNKIDPYFQTKQAHFDQKRLWWVNDPEDPVFLGWGHDFVLVRRLIRDGPVPAEQKRSFRFPYSKPPFCSCPTCPDLNPQPEDPNAIRTWL